MKLLNVFACAAILFCAAGAFSAPRAAEINSTSTLTDTAPVPDAPPSETAFVPAIDDLPLMPGLYPVADEDTLFIVPQQGRIATSAVQGSVDIDDVYKFYRHSLPHLGWTIVDGRTYERGDERLRINAHADGKVTTVHFSVNPR